MDILKSIRQLKALVKLNLSYSQIAINEFSSENLLDASNFLKGRLRKRYIIVQRKDDNSFIPEQNDNKSKIKHFHDYVDRIITQSDINMIKRLYQNQIEGGLFEENFEKYQDENG